MLKRHHPQEIVAQLAASGLDIYNPSQAQARYIRKNFKAWLGTFPKWKLEVIATALDARETSK
jgi:hypothetical protein